MNLAEIVAARRSIREFTSEPVPRVLAEYAIGLAVQAPAPHHSAPWRFALLEGAQERSAFSETMGSAWRRDLAHDGVSATRIERVVARSHRLLIGAPLLIVTCADTGRAHDYPDEARRLAEWSLFAHSVGAALQVLMMALAEKGVASCWLSAPVFCRDAVRGHLGLPENIEPHALVLAGRPSPSYRPRPRPEPSVSDYLLDT